MSKINMNIIKIAIIYLSILGLTFPIFASDLVKIDIIKVTDGDTVKAIFMGEKISIRLSDIDCFETSNNKRAYWQAEYYKKSLGEVIKQGKQSKEILSKLLNQNKSNIYIQKDGKDKYKRTLGTLYIGKRSKNINDYMLKSGKCEKYISKKSIKNQTQ